jgi:hypothetical protein
MRKRDTMFTYNAIKQAHQGTNLQWNKYLLMPHESGTSARSQV